MVTAARYVFLVLSWLFLAGVVVQTFLAGYFLFADPAAVETHVNVGWILHLVPILIAVAAALARPGARTVWLAVAMAVVVFITPILPSLRGSVPAAAALHPVFALLTFGLAVALAWASWQAVREAPSAPLPTAAERP